MFTIMRASPPAGRRASEQASVLEAAAIDRRLVIVWCRDIFDPPTQHVALPLSAAAPLAACHRRCTSCQPSKRPIRLCLARALLQQQGAWLRLA
jgi:hypothetical protein